MGSMLKLSLDSDNDSSSNRFMLVKEVQRNVNKKEPKHVSMLSKIKKIHLFLNDEENVVVLH